MAAMISDTILSQVSAQIIPCGNSTIRRRFALEYLDIDHKEFENITHDQRGQREEIVYHCLSRWRHKQQERANLVTVESLVGLLDHVALDSNGRWDFKVYDRPFRPRFKCPTWSCGFQSFAISQLRPVSMANHKL